DPSGGARARWSPFRRAFPHKSPERHPGCLQRPPNSQTQAHALTVKRRPAPDGRTATRKATSRRGTMNAGKVETSKGRTGRRFGGPTSLKAAKCSQGEKPFRPRLELLEERDCPAVSSKVVAVIGSPDVSNGGFFPTTGTDVAGYTFTNLSPASV